MKHLAVLLPIALFGAPSLAVAAPAIAEAVPISAIPAASAGQPAAEAATPWSVLVQPVETERGLKVFGVCAVLAVAIGRLRPRDGDKLKR